MLAVFIRQYGAKRRSDLRRYLCELLWWIQDLLEAFLIGICLLKVIDLALGTALFVKLEKTTVIDIVTTLLSLLINSVLFVIFMF